MKLAIHLLHDHWSDNTINTNVDSVEYLIYAVLQNFKFIIASVYILVLVSIERFRICVRKVGHQIIQFVRSQVSLSIHS